MGLQERSANYSRFASAAKICRNILPTSLFHFERYRIEAVRRQLRNRETASDRSSV